VVGFFAANDKKTNETFTAIANQLRDEYLFGAINDADAAKAEGVKQPGVVLYKSYDEGKDIYNGKINKDDVITFTKTSSTPLVGEVSPETYQFYMDSGVPLAYIFDETEEGRQKLSEALKPVAKKHKGVVNFATIDASAFGAHAGNLNLEQKWPAFAIQDIAGNKKYPFDQSKEIIEKHIGQFLKDFVAGKLEPSIKSEDIPQDNSGPVKVVVAKNYNELVIDNDKDVLLEFYAPWCGHCKALAPKYEELGALYTSVADYDSKVTIAKIDATANDVPDEIQGFPTIKIFKAGDKENPIEYTGDRTVEDLVQFIAENGKHAIDANASKPEASEDGEVGDTAKAASAKVTSKATTTESESKATDKATDEAKDKTKDKHDEL